MWRFSVIKNFQRRIDRSKMWIQSSQLVSRDVSCVIQNKNKKLPRWKMWTFRIRYIITISMCHHIHYNCVHYQDSLCKLIPWILSTTNYRVGFGLTIHLTHHNLHNTELLLRDVCSWQIPMTLHLITLLIWSFLNKSSNFWMISIFKITIAIPTHHYHDYYYVQDPNLRD